MHKHTVNFLARGDKMNVRDVLMMAAGSAMVLAYQKYNKPVMEKVKQTATDGMKTMKDKLENMM